MVFLVVSPAVVSAQDDEHTVAMVQQHDEQAQVDGACRELIILGRADRCICPFSF